MRIRTTLLALALAAATAGAAAESSRTLTGEYVLPGGEESGAIGGR